MKKKLIYALGIVVMYPPHNPPSSKAAEEVRE